ncbi:MAG TPA: M55 family metallopeptidase [Candidatus Brocadiia bacterium]|nr:M55 family metallopeptidase [Candidatus Brocadiia bacterium]
MKLYLYTDCQNLSGLLFGGFGLPPWFDIPPLQEQAAHDRMAREVAAVAQACNRAGATDILVHEAHPLELLNLPDNVRVLRGSNKLLLDNTFDAILFAGQHVNPAVAAAQDRRQAGLASLTLNGQPLSELEIVARAAGEMGIPTALITGQASVIHAAAKALGAAVPLAPTDNESYGALDAAVGAALKAVRDGHAPVVTPPAAPAYRLDIQFSTRFHAERCDRFDDATLTGPRTCRIEKSSWAEVLEAYTRLGIVLDSTSIVLPRLIARNEKSK